MSYKSLEWYFNFQPTADATWNLIHVLCVVFTDIWNILSLKGNVKQYNFKNFHALHRILKQKRAKFPSGIPGSNFFSLKLFVVYDATITLPLSKEALFLLFQCSRIGNMRHTGTLSIFINRIVSDCGYDLLECIGSSSHLCAFMTPSWWTVLNINTLKSGAINGLKGTECDRRNFLHFSIGHCICSSGTNFIFQHKRFSPININSFLVATWVNLLMDCYSSTYCYVV